MLGLSRTNELSLDGEYALERNLVYQRLQLQFLTIHVSTWLDFLDGFLQSSTFVRKEADVPVQLQDISQALFRV